MKGKFLGVIGMKRIYITLIGLLLCSGGYSQEFIKDSVENKIGLSDIVGNVIDHSKYDAIGDFSEGFAKVKLGQKWGYIDTMGNEVIPLKYDEIEDFFKGFAKVKLDWKWGYIDTMGNEVTPLKYDKIEDFSEGFAKVKLGSKWGYIDTMGKEVTPLKYDEIDDFSEGFAIVQLGGYWGYIDMEGNEVTPLKYDIAERFYRGFARVGRSDYIDKTGKEMFNTLVKSYHEQAKQLSEQRGRRSRAFKVKGPYLLVDGDFRYWGLESYVYSNPNFIEEQINPEVNTLIFSYKNGEIKNTYTDKENRFGRKQTISSSGVILIYFDMETKEFIGSEYIPPRPMPHTLTTAYNLGISIEKMIEKIESRLVNLNR